MMKTWISGVLLAAVLGIVPAAAEPRHGIAMHGDAALPADFKSLPYANPDAPKGGIFRQAVTGSFDSVNPFIVKGQKAVSISTYVFESMMSRNYGEAFSVYGLLAESIDVSPDRNKVTFVLRPEARFSDGTPVTSADVAFSLAILRDHGLPRFKTYYSKIRTLETPDARTIVMTQDEGDRELPLIMGLMPILPKHYWEKRNFEASTLDPIMGSGPYVFAGIEPGERISLKKNPDYWGKDVPLNRGVWNFDEVRFDYFRDHNSAFEAFKKGLADIRVETDPTRWTYGYDFPAVAEGRVIRERIEQQTPAAASGFAFNTRIPLFEDPKVRRALTEAFDFEWLNDNLLYGLYRRTQGYYSGSELSYLGHSADAREMALLGTDASRIDPRILDGTYVLPRTDGSGRDRKVLRGTVTLLKEAGWEIRDGALVNIKTNAPFTFTISCLTREQEKIALHYQRTLKQIGIDVRIRQVDSAQFQRMLDTYEFDMLPVMWYNSLSPGNEQDFYYGSAGRTVPGTRNYPGIADPAVDRMIAALLSATTREDFVSAVRALDRLLVSGFYIVPFYDSGGQWVARWDTIGRPKQPPLPGFEGTALWYAKP
ncbi:ABC transporter substrate-binding protein [Nordella sp. HKS 07]|uniref:extracellular solute-binding protein n=1 Tax=Nordella sp. HKS 07 TaxID=2712222 RepID=UPI0013E18319|nr:extracellular solute-binding protein [Nordella sp. HKS 07]QIG51415.1 ABC transporter substrate-binding protein [Nordella sp. HKS 07]